MTGPLSGIRIIEFAGIGPGPFCGMMLADHGAEVIRIDRLIPSFTVKNGNDDLNFAMFDWSDDLREFVERGRAAGIAAAGMSALNRQYATLSPRAAKEQVFVTCIPWLDFTSIQHPFFFFSL